MATVNKQSITSLPPAPDSDHKKRMIKYTIAMLIRMACFVACFFTSGYLLLFFVIAAAILPWIAVTIANNVDNRGGAIKQPDSQALVPDSKLQKNKKS